MKPIKTLLVPVDFGEPSDAAQAYALDLAEAMGARLYLLHSYQLPVIGYADGAYVAPEVTRRVMEAAQEALDEAVKRCTVRKVEVTPLLRQGDPRDSVLEVAKEVCADLIVMGTHGRRGIARALIGSTTESVVRTANVPVLSVHAAPQAA